jgi:hypothetical protein
VELKLTDKQFERIMALNLDLPPELEQYLLQEAEQRGLSVEAMTLQLLTQLLQRRQKQAEAVDMLQSWIDDEDVEEQQETGEYLIQVLDEDRLSDRKLFPLEMKGVTW